MEQKTIGYGLFIIGAILLVLIAGVKSEMDRQSVFLCQAVEADPTLEMSECPAHTSNTSWFVMLGFGLSVVILAAGLYLIFAPAKNTPKKVDVKKLSAEEKTIYTTLTEHEGSMYQGDLVKKTEFSKVKITRLLDGLEQKGIVERKRRGMTNLVILK